MRLAEKTAIVTGGAGGIGRGIVRAFEDGFDEIFTLAAQVERPGLRRRGRSRT